MNSPKVWPMPALRTHPRWRERANVEVLRALDALLRAEREAAVWLAEVKARKAAK